MIVSILPTIRNIQESYNIYSDDFASKMLRLTDMELRNKLEKNIPPYFKQCTIEKHYNSLIATFK